MHCRSPLVLSLLLATACGSQMGGGAGDVGPLVPLAYYNGPIAGEAPLPAFDVRFAWYQGAPPSMQPLELADEEGVRKYVNATATYFQLLFYVPPPEAAFRRLTDDEPRFAWGSAVTIPNGVTPAEVPLLPTSGNPAYGADVTHWMIYLADDVPEGSLTAWWLGSPLGGDQYYLFRVDAAPCLKEAQLAACAEDLAERGAPDLEAARAFCGAPYRLARVTSWEEPGLITLGTSQVPPPASCP